MSPPTRITVGGGADGSTPYDVVIGTRLLGGLPALLGDQVQREGPERRFVYIRVGQAAGDHASPWSRRMKIDIHDTDPALLDEATKGGILVLTVDGTAKDGSPVCATVRPVAKKVVAA